MGRGFDTVKEWINPRWGTHRKVPPLSAGLRPNDALESVDSLGVNLEADSLAVIGGGVYFSVDDTVQFRGDDGVRLLAKFDGPVTALTAQGTLLIAAVEGRGLVALGLDGKTEELSVNELLCWCVTDIAVGDNGTLLATVGSTQYRSGEWSSALLTGDRSGRLVLLEPNSGRAEVVAEGLAWPSGCEWAGEDFLLSLSLDHRIERRSAAHPAQRRSVLMENMPIYPGRIAAAEDGWWFAAPYVRNRFTELLLDESDAVADMMASIDRDQWFVPRLNLGNPWTDPLQIGQIRVLGVIKPWAPARSYGLVFHMDANGRVTRSLHSRADGRRHGITDIAINGDSAVVAARGAQDIYKFARQG